MLKTRVITAVLMLAVFVPSLFFLPQAGWAAFIAIVAGVAAWEWGGLMQAKARHRLFAGVAFGFICLLWLAFEPQTLGVKALFAPQGAMPVHAVSVAFWLLLVPLWMRCKWRLPAGMLGWLVGLVVIFPTWLALVQLRQLGVATLLMIVAVVWVADIAAYFFGRLFGRHKLAINISPGKTWEGAIGGAFAVLAYGLMLRHLFGLEQFPLWLWLLALPVATMVSIVGDLFESLLKRQVGLKDSSQVLPGHGGVLDRVDSLTSTMPLVALFWILAIG